MNKKAVSPLIATVLLVMIVVSIGAAVMVVIQGLSEDTLASVDAQKQLIRCGTDVEVGIIEVGSSARVCFDAPPDTANNGNFTLYIENKGTRDISGWRFTVIGDDGIFDSSNQGTSLAKGEIKGFRFFFNQTGVTVAEHAKIRLYPQIPGGPTNPLVTCQEPNLEWDTYEIADLNLCSALTWDDNI